MTVPFALQLNNLPLCHPSPSTLLSHINVRSTCGLCDRSHISIEALDLKNETADADTMGARFRKTKKKKENVTFRPPIFAFRFPRSCTERTAVRARKNSPCARCESPSRDASLKERTDVGQCRRIGQCRRVGQFRRVYIRRTQTSSANTRGTDITAKLRCAPVAAKRSAPLAPPRIDRARIRSAGDVPPRGALLRPQRGLRRPWSRACKCITTNYMKTFRALDKKYRFYSRYSIK